jgi:hypothetical protein
MTDNKSLKRAWFLLEQDMRGGATLNDIYADVDNIELTKYKIVSDDEGGSEPDINSFNQGYQYGRDIVLNVAVEVTWRNNDDSEAMLDNLCDQITFEFFMNHIHSTDFFHNLRDRIIESGIIDEKTPGGLVIEDEKSVTGTIKCIGGSVTEVIINGLKLVETADSRTHTDNIFFNPK